MVARLCGEPSASASDFKLIQEEIRQQRLRCICPSKFRVQKVDDGKYKVSVTSSDLSHEFSFSLQDSLVYLF